MIATLLAALGLGLPMAPTSSVQVLVLPTESAPDQSGFVEALRIQLAGAGDVRPGPPVTGATLPEKVEAATHAVDEADATLAVWIERGPSTDREGVDFILHVVGRKSGRLLVEVFRLPALDAPETDRALALKVRDALDSLLEPPEEAMGGSPAEWLGHYPPRPNPAHRTRLLLEVGGRAAPGIGSPESQAAPLLAAGVRLPLRPMAVDFYLSGSLPNGISDSNRAGSVETDEISVALGARVVAETVRFSLDARVELGARLIDAHGVTPFGAEGDKRVAVPSVVAGLGAGKPLRPGVDLCAFVGLEAFPWRQSLTVNEIPVLDLGRVRPLLQLSVLVTAP